MNTLEIIIPVRNPTPVLEQTVKSLTTQTDRGFSVLLSDNHSTLGLELITSIAGLLESAGIAVRKIRPPVELGRVEHWNWAHYQAKGGWLKPLFAGDWLEPTYVEKLRTRLAAWPKCKYAFSPFVLHHGDAAPVNVSSRWSAGFHTPAEMSQVVLRNGMQFGPPSAAAYEAAAFIGCGGYPTYLPICADSLLFCLMASRYGALGLGEPLCHFNIHSGRFSATLPGKRRATFREKVTYSMMLAYHAWTENVDFSRIAFLRLLLRETRAYLRER